MVAKSSSQKAIAKAFTRTEGVKYLIGAHVSTSEGKKLYLLSNIILIIIKTNQLFFLSIDLLRC